MSGAVSKGRLRRAEGVYVRVCKGVYAATCLSRSAEPSRWRGDSSLPCISARFPAPRGYMWCVSTSTGGRALALTAAAAAAATASGSAGAVLSAGAAGTGHERLPRNAAYLL